MVQRGGQSWQPSERIRRAFPQTGRYLVGVSGGRDSVALLHWLRSCGYNKLIVCHLDHQLRGRASRADAKFVERLARRLDCAFVGIRADVPQLARRSRQSLETAGRAARLRFFAQVARRRRCHAIFLGHHADDLVETFLFNLLRGAGAAGLSGIREIANQRGLTIVRPLLSVWRSEIHAYVKAHRLEFREDDSNAELTPLRNRVRGRIIPYLEKTLGRNVRQSLWRAASIFAEENAWLDSLVDPELIEAKELAVAKLRPQPVAAQRRAIQKWLREQQVSDVGYDLVERVCALIAPDASVAKTNLPHGHYVRRRVGKLFIE